MNRRDHNAMVRRGITGAQARAIRRAAQPAESERRCPTTGRPVFWDGGQGADRHADHFTTCQEGRCG